MTGEDESDCLTFSPTYHSARSMNTIQALISHAHKEDCMDHAFSEVVFRNQLYNFILIVAPHNSHILLVLSNFARITLDSSHYYTYTINDIGTGQRHLS